MGMKVVNRSVSSVSRLSLSLFRYSFSPLVFYSVSQCIHSVFLFAIYSVHCSANKRVVWLVRSDYRLANYSDTFLVSEFVHGFIHL